MHLQNETRINLKYNLLNSREISSPGTEEEENQLFALLLLLQKRLFKLWVEIGSNAQDILDCCQFQVVLLSS